MPKFEIWIERDISYRERFTRVIVAEDHADADGIADKLAYESNRNCPDDCSAVDRDQEDIGGFVVADVQPAPDDAEVDEL